MLNQLDTFQGKSISLEEVKEIKKIQDALISSCLTEINNINSRLIKNNSNDPFCKFMQFFKGSCLGLNINKLDCFITKQRQFYHAFHNAQIRDVEKMLLEFLVGLGRFTVTSQLISKFIHFVISNKKINLKEVDFKYPEYIEKNRFDFFKQISKISDFIFKLIEFISSIYTIEQPSQYWRDVEEFFFIHKNLIPLVDSLVSLQYIPEDNRFLAAMQTMHWRGFGGVGEILLQHNQLKKLAIHAIGHHGGLESNLFTERLNVFKLPLQSMLESAQKLIANFLNNCFPNEDIHLYDFCSGPNFAAIKDLITLLNNRRFKLTLSDVDGASLESILKKQMQPTYNLTIEDVRYFDLMLTHSSGINEFEKYHLISLNLGFHQIQLVKIYDSLNYFLNIIKPGGLIVNLDASRRSYGQIMMIPGNIVDREGHVPYAHEMDLNRLAVFSNNRVKLAYPLVKLTNKIINEIDVNIGEGPYMITFYLVLYLNISDFNILKLYWRSKNYDLGDKLIEKYTNNIPLIKLFI